MQSKPQEKDNSLFDEKTSASAARDDKGDDPRPVDNGLDDVIESNWNEIAHNFDEMKLREELLRGIYAYGFDKPTAIQQRAIIPSIRGHDVLAQAQSGTGKTATLSISILQQLDLTLKECQALILAPTRELAHAIKIFILTLSNYMDVTCHACMGGTNLKEDLSKLKEGVQIVVGTPGRVSDMITRKVLNTQYIKLFVLDEADEILGRGFKENIQEVFTKMPHNIQVLLLSATMPEELFEVTKIFMKKPMFIIDKKEED